MKYTHEVLANFHGHAVDPQPHTNQLHTTRRPQNATDAPATPPKGGKAAKIPPRKQNSNLYHNLNDLISSDCAHDEHDCYYEACKEDHMKDYERPVGIKPVISTIPYRNTAAPQPPSKMDMLRNQAQQNATDAPATPPKGGKAAKIPPRKQNSNLYHNLNDLISSDCAHDEHDCYYEACKEDHMKDYERPVGIKPVISTIPYAYDCVSIPFGIVI